MYVCSEHQDGPAGKQGTHRVGEEFCDPGRGVGQTEGLIFKGSANMCVLMNLETVVCVCHLQSLPAQEEEGTRLSLIMLYVSRCC